MQKPAIEVSYGFLFFGGVLRNPKLEASYIFLTAGIPNSTKGPSLPFLRVGLPCDSVALVYREKCDKLIQIDTEKLIEMNVVETS